MRALLPDSHRYSVTFHAVTQKGAQPNLVLERFLDLLSRPVAKTVKPGPRVTEAR
jgi:LysR family transcriptional regulator, transcriptional activator for bauABCD operon